MKTFTFQLTSGAEFTVQGDTIKAGWIAAIEFLASQGELQFVATLDLVSVE